MSKTAMRSAAAEAFERQMLRAGQPLVEKWKHFIDAENAPAIEGASDRVAMAKMLESTNSQLEATQTTTVFGTNYVKSMLGLTRQIFPRLFGTQLVAVQPMDRPTGQVFHLAVTRDDGSSNGLRPQDNATNQNSAALLASRTYADHGAQGVVAPGEGQPIQKGMALSITSTDVSIGAAKKLKVGATLELVQDLQAVHGLNALDLLQSAAVDEISAEIDAVLVQAVRTAAIAHKTITFGGVAPAGYSQREWNQELPRAIVKADRAIAKASLRRPNVIVCGFDALEALINLNGFAFNPNQDWDAGSISLSPAGTLMGSNAFQVFVSRFIPDNEILIGRKGAGFLDAGIVYSPYVALFISDRVFDVATQKTEQSFASRYGVNTIANHLYARVVIDSASNAGIV